MSDWFERALEDSTYDVTWDLDEMEKEYKCDKCGCIFTLDEAFCDFEDRFNGDLTYNGCGYDGSLCGHCAADREKKKFFS